jgi:hypothetical protein
MAIVLKWLLYSLQTLTWQGRHFGAARGGKNLGI